MMIALLDEHQRVIEIPVNYFNRSQSLHRKYRTASTFFAFFGLFFDEESKITNSRGI